MDPFRFVLTIIGIALVYHLLKVHMARRARQTSGAEGSLLHDRLDSLEARICVLERIVTDERDDRKRELGGLGG